MMPPFEGIGSGEDDAFHREMMKEAALDDEEDEEDDDDEIEQVAHSDSNKENRAHEALSSKARLFGNPTPFPNEALLEKLSNKLAQEEEESLNQSHHRILGPDTVKMSNAQPGPVFKVNQLP